MKENILSYTSILGDEYTELYLDYEEIIIRDKSRRKRVLTNQNVATSTTIYHNGGRSAYFNNSNSRLQTTIDGNLDFGTKDFTLETWLHIPSLTSNTSRCFCFGQLDNQGWFATFSSGAYPNDSQRWTFALSNNNNVPNYITNSVSIPAINTWAHIACERYNGEIYLFLNGIKNTPVTTFPDDISVTVKTLTIGSLNRVGGLPILPFHGYLDNTILTIGKAKYKNNFTPI